MPIDQGYFAAQPDPVGQLKAGTEYVNSLFDAARKRDAGQQFAAGNYRGASTTLAEGGDIKGAMGVQDYDQQQFEKRQSYIKQAAPIFQAALAKDGEQGVVQAFGVIAPELKAQGVPDEQIQRYGELARTNPRGLVQVLGLTAAKKYTTEKVGDTLFVMEEGNPNPVAAITGGKTTVLGQGDKAIQTDPQVQQTGGGGASPFAGGAPPPVSTPVDGGAPLINGANPQATAYVESGNNPNAVSPAGAEGTMQVMPDTQTDPGYGVAPARDGSAGEKTRVGEEYLNTMVQKYGSVGGHIAYNWGPGNFERWQRQGAHPDQSPRETRDYLLKTALAQAFPRSAPQAAAPQQGGGARVIAENAPKAVKPTATWRPLDAGEQTQYPGAVAINSETLEPKYPPQQIVKSENARGKMRDLLEARKQRVKLVTENIDKALGQIGTFTTGAGSYLSNLRGTPARDLKATLETIKANIGFDQLSEMRLNSPTGGALGQISDRETALLQSVLGSITEEQTEDQLRANLTRVKKALADGIKDRESAFGRDFSNQQGPTGGPSPGTVKGGYRFKGGNPADQNSWEKV